MSSQQHCQATSLPPTPLPLLNTPLPVAYLRGELSNWAAKGHYKREVLAKRQPVDPTCSSRSIFSDHLGPDAADLTEINRMMLFRYSAQPCPLVPPPKIFQTSFPVLTLWSWEVRINDLMAHIHTGLASVFKFRSRTTLFNRAIRTVVAFAFVYYVVLPVAGMTDSDDSAHVQGM